MNLSLRIFAPVLIGAALALSGCPGPEDGHDHDHDHDIEETDGHVCEHFEEQGALESVTAAADVADAPLVFEDPHLVYDIDFTQGAENNGSVRFTAQEAHADGLLYLSADVPVELTDASGAVVAPSTVEGEPACASVNNRARYHLHSGSYILTFGASAETSVQALLTYVESDH